jgi:prolipoprotein diacylglyceryltransferase
LLVALGAGKLAMAFGGTGQGAPLDAAWATAYLGDGPWGSLAPELASHPAQLYEGFAVLLLALLIGILGAGRASRGRDGRLLLLAVAAWAAIRAAVSTTWRDPVAVGPLPTGGAIAVGIVVGAVVVLVAGVLWSGRRTRAAAGGDEPSWPDPETRPQF